MKYRSFLHFLSLSLSFFLSLAPFLSPLSAQTFQSRGIGGGGALFAPSINPANNDEIYMECDLAAVFHSKNKGESWEYIPFQQLQSWHDSQVQFTKDPNILYCVHSPSLNGSDKAYAVKSTDGGKNWGKLLGNPFSESPDLQLVRVLADYNHPERVVLADYGTVYFSNNGGTTFTKIHTCLSNGSGNHIAGWLFDENNIYIGTNDGILFSTDAGVTFNTMTVSGIPTGEFILSFAGAKQGAMTRFFCLTASSVWASYQYGSNYSNAMKGVYSMDNANGTWTKKVNGIATGADYPTFVSMANNDISTAYLSGGSTTSKPIVLKTTNGGDLWQAVFKTANNANIATGWEGDKGDHDWWYGEAPFGFQVCPNNKNVVIMTTFSNAHVTYDGGATWQQTYVTKADQNPMAAATPKSKKYQGVGCENTTNWQVMWYDSTTIFSPFSDIGGVTSTDKGVSWKFIPSMSAKNSIYRVVKHLNGTLYGVTSSVHDLYTTPRIYDAQINGGTSELWISNDKGATFTQLKSFGASGGVACWIALDPTNAERAYVAVAHNTATKGGLWKTENLSAGIAATWTLCAKPPRTEGHIFNVNVLTNGDLVVSYSARKATSSTAFSQSAGVFYSTDKGATWQDRTAANMKFYTKDVVIDPKNESTWYAAVFQAWGSGVPLGTGGLYKTTDKGGTWKQISTSYRVNSATINPLKTNELYFTTETEGLWFSDNIDTANPTFKQVESYPFRHPMRVFFNPFKPTEYWVSSYGAGMMQSGAAVVTCVPPTAAITGANSFCEGKNTTLSTPQDSKWTYQWFLNNTPLPTANQATLSIATAGNYSVSVSNGQCAATSNAFVVTTVANPTAAITTPNNTTKICGEMPILLLSPNNTGVQYQWFLNNTLLNGANNATFSAIEGGLYTLNATQNGCSATANLTLTQEAVLHLFERDTVCSGYPLHLDWTTPNATNYTWSDTTATNPIRNLKLGTYTLTTKFTTACPSIRTITVENYAPINLVIMVNNAVLTATATTEISTYQWFLNGVLVGNSNPFTATKNGVYSLLAIDKNGCKITSSPINVTIVATEDIQLNNLKISALPNPFTDKLNLKITTQEKTRLTLTLYTLEGKQTKIWQKTTVPQGEQTIELEAVEDLPAGAYRLHCVAFERLEQTLLLIKN